MKFRIKVEEELYYPSSETKGADQLRSYCEADLRLCFRLDRLLVFPCGGSKFKQLGTRTTYKILVAVLCILPLPESWPFHLRVCCRGGRASVQRFCG